MVSDGTLLAIWVWWAWLALFGILAWPLAGFLAPGSADRGYLAARSLALLVASYAAWLASSLKLLDFSAHAPMFGLGALCVTFLLFQGKFSLPRLRAVVLAEAVFLLHFAIGLWIRLTNPDIGGLEKFMDFGFMNAAMRTASMPPQDPWLAGEVINYYYFGHVVSAWITLATGVARQFGYNLMLATIFALAGGLAFAIVRDNLNKAGKTTAGAVGLLVSLAITLGGNFHTVLYGAFRSFVNSTTGRPEFYYPDSTRFIGFDPVTDDKAFTEMPAYGFAVGDLHAHLLNVPTTLLILFFLFVIIAELRVGPAGEMRPKISHIAILGFLLGTALLTSAWDFAIFGLVITIAGLFLVILNPTGKIRNLLRFSVAGCLLVGIALLVATPFLIHFVPFAQGLRLAEKHTPLWQMLVLYLHVLPGCLAALGLVILSGKREPSIVYAAILSVAAILLIAIPEVVYVKDVYGADYARANTVFKLSFQAQAIAVLSASIAVGHLLLSKKLLVIALPISVLLFSPLIYPHYWLLGRYFVVPFSEYSLNGWRYVTKQDPDDAPMLPIIDALQLAPGELLLEGFGDSYTHAARFSALTGQQTAVGWSNHVYLWHGKIDDIQRVERQVSSFYESATLADACRLARQMNIRYVVVGEHEHSKFKKLNESLMMTMGRTLRVSGRTRLFEIDPETCTNS